jgi:hypothetical protein
MDSMKPRYSSDSEIDEEPADRIYSVKNGRPISSNKPQNEKISLYD